MEEKIGKTRYWTSVMWEESKPKDWYEQLEKTMIKICVSPLHDKDIDINTGKLKKPHRHILYCFEGPTTMKNVQRIAKKVGNEYAEPVYSPKGCWEYFIHKNNPEKAQYEPIGYININGFNIDDIKDLTIVEKEQIKRELISMIIDKNIQEYEDLCNQLLKAEMYDYLTVASNNTLFFVSYLRSKRFRSQVVQNIFTN